MTRYHEQQAKLRAEIQQLLETTTLSYLDIAKQMDCTPNTVYTHARRLKLRRQADPKAVVND
jgi:DNA-binding CsgD family transcriptional regulator